MVQTFNLSSLEAEAGESGIQSPPWLHSNFDASLGYMRPCLQKKKKIFRKEPFSSSQTGARKGHGMSLTSGEGKIRSAFHLKICDTLLSTHLQPLLGGGAV